MHRVECQYHPIPLSAEKPPGLWDPLAGFFKKAKVVSPPSLPSPPIPEVVAEAIQAAAEAAVIQQTPEVVAGEPIVAQASTLLGEAVQGVATINSAASVADASLIFLEGACTVSNSSVTILQPIENPAALPLSFSRRIFASQSLRTFSYIALLVTAIAFLAYFLYRRIYQKNVGPLDKEEQGKLISPPQEMKIESNAPLQESVESLIVEEKSENWKFFLSALFGGVVSHFLSLARTTPSGGFAGQLGSILPRVEAMETSLTRLDRSSDDQRREWNSALLNLREEVQTLLASAARANPTSDFAEQLGSILTRVDAIEISLTRVDRSSDDQRREWNSALLNLREEVQTLSASAARVTSTSSFAEQLGSILTRMEAMETSLTRVDRSSDDQRREWNSALLNLRQEVQTLSASGARASSTSGFAEQLGSILTRLGAVETSLTRVDRSSDDQRREWNSALLNLREEVQTLSASAARATSTTDFAEQLGSILTRLGAIETSLTRVDRSSDDQRREWNSALLNLREEVQTLSASAARVASTSSFAEQLGSILTRMEAMETSLTRVDRSSDDQRREWNSTLLNLREEVQTLSASAARATSISSFAEQLGFILNRVGAIETSLTRVDRSSDDQRREWNSALLNLRKEVQTLAGSMGDSAEQSQSLSLRIGEIEVSLRRYLSEFEERLRAQDQKKADQFKQQILNIEEHLKRESDRLSRTYDGIETRVERTEAGIKNFQALHGDFAQLAARLSRIESSEETKQLSLRIDQLAKEIKEVSERTELSVGRLRVQVEDFDQTLKANGEFQSLKTRLISLTTQLDQLGSSFSLASESRTPTTPEEEGAKIELFTGIAEMRRNLDQLNGLDASLRRLQEVVRLLDERVSKLENSQELSELRIQIEAILTQSSGMQDGIRTANEAISQLREQIDPMRQDLRSAAAAIANEQIQREKLDKRLMSLVGPPQRNAPVLYNPLRQLREDPQFKDLILSWISEQKRSLLHSANPAESSSPSHHRSEDYSHLAGPKGPDGFCLVSDSKVLEFLRAIPTNRGKYGYREDRHRNLSWVEYTKLKFLAKDMREAGQVTDAIEESRSPPWARASEAPVHYGEAADRLLGGRKSTSSSRGPSLPVTPQRRSLATSHDSNSSKESK